MSKYLGIRGYLFDTWRGFPDFSEMDISSKKDKLKMKHRIETASDTYDDCVANLSKNGNINLCNMIRGDILQTVPDFVKNLNNFSISMMHIDTDLYNPAKVSLECFWPFISNTGVVFFHDYGDKKWKGIKKVVDNLVSSYNDLHFYSFNNDKIFSACIVKGKSDLSASIYREIKYLDKE